jgi:hypothetical protein
MGPATQFDTDPRYSDNTDKISIFLAEKANCTLTNGIIHGCFPSLNTDIFQNVDVYGSLNDVDLFTGKSRKVGKIKA